MTDIIIFALEIIGVIAFAISGALVGIGKKMDILGISILGLSVAVGGGVIRDLILGITPPMTFRNPVYATVAILTSIISRSPSLMSICKILKYREQKSRISSLLIGQGLSIHFLGKIVSNVHK